MTVEGWKKVISTNESAFNIGGVQGNIWVIRKPDENDKEYCLILKFHKLSLLIGWGAISGVEGKQILLFWDKKCGQKVIQIIF